MTILGGGSMSLDTSGRHFPDDSPTEPAAPPVRRRVGSLDAGLGLGLSVSPMAMDRENVRTSPLAADRDRLTKKVTSRHNSITSIPEMSIFTEEDRAAIDEQARHHRNLAQLSAFIETQHNLVHSVGHSSISEPHDRGSPGRRGSHNSTSQQSHASHASGQAPMSLWEMQQQGMCMEVTLPVGSRARQAWDIGCLFAVIYCTFMVPYDMTFEPEKSEAVIVLDILIEIYFLIDIGLNFFTSYLNEEGDEVCCKRKVALHYLKGWFPIDAVSSIPSECIHQISLSLEGGVSQDVQGLYVVKIFRILRLTKLLRLLQLGKLIEMLEFTFPQLTIFISLFRLLFMMVTTAHINACIFYLIATYDMGNSWVSLRFQGCCDPNEDYPSAGAGSACFDRERIPGLWIIFNAAPYWSFATLATVGYGDITPCNQAEMIYTVGSMVVGSAMFAYIVGNISQVVTSRKGQELKLKKKMRELQEYLAIRKIPREMSDKIRRQCLHRWKRTVFDEPGVLSEFTPQMRRSVLKYVYGDALAAVPTFAACQGDNPNFVTDLTVRMQPCSAQPGDNITIAGEVGGDLYVIVSGIVELQGSGEAPIATLGPGGCFNELELLSDTFSDEITPYVATARALTNCETYLLSHSDFVEVLGDHQNVISTLEGQVERLLEQRIYEVVRRVSNQDPGMWQPWIFDHGELSEAGSADALGGGGEEEGTCASRAPSNVTHASGKGKRLMERRRSSLGSSCSAVPGGVHALEACLYDAHAHMCAQDARLVAALRASGLGSETLEALAGPEWGGAGGKDAPPTLAAPHAGYSPSHGHAGGYGGGWGGDGGASKSMSFDVGRFMPTSAVTPSDRGRHAGRSQSPTRVPKERFQLARRRVSINTHVI